MHGTQNINLILKPKNVFLGSLEWGFVLQI